MPALTPEQEMLREAAQDLENEPGESFGNKVQVVNRYQRLANPAAILAILAQLEAVQAIPDVLFDGNAVYEEVQRKAGHIRTSPENVSDVLDAVVRLIRAAKAAPGEPGQ